MTRSVFNRCVVAAALFAGVVAVAAGAERETGPARKKKVLVELYTSQGCDSCPPASELLGALEELGYDTEKIVPIGFHVDYFNDPWVDRYSDAAFSRRELEYNEVLGRDDLYFTPMMMIDGATPLLGSDRPKVLAGVERALKAPAGLTLAAKLEGTRDARTLAVELSKPALAVAGRDLLVGVVLTEGPLTTEVRSGENDGKRLVEHFVARSFRQQRARVERSGPKKLSVPVALREGQDPARTRVAVFVQDRQTGAVYQADSLPWDPPPKKRRQSSNVP